MKNNAGSRASTKILTYLAVCALATLATLVLRPRPSAPVPPPLAKSPEDPLAALNDQFRAAYGRYRADQLARLGPVILVEGDDLVLIHQGSRRQVRTVPRRYHELKAIAHVPLAAYLLLKPVAAGDVSPERWEAIRMYRERLARLGESLESDSAANLNEEHVRLLTRWRGMLDLALATRRVDHDAFLRQVREDAPIVLNLAAEAARAQIDALHAQVEDWRQKMPPADWRRLHVVVMGSQMPRKGNLNVQYFARLLGEPGEGSRIVYAEALWEERRALDLLGTHVVDTEIGRDFFGDDRRMHRDLLSDAAEAHLKTLVFSP